jgi:PAS domain S-box-containing protein
LDISDLPDAVLIVDAEGRVLETNAAAERLYAIPRAEMIGQPLSALFRYQWLRPEDEALARSALATDGVWRGENAVVRRDGKVLRVEAIVTAERQAGKVVRIFAVIRDVTHRRDEAAAPLQQRVRAVSDSVQEYAIATLDLEGCISSWNDGARQLSGYTSDEVIGKSISIFYLPEDVAARVPEREMETARRTGKSEVEGWRVRKDGTRLWINEIMTPLDDPGGTLVGYTKVCRDVTERKRAEETLRNSEERVRLILERIADYAVFTQTLDGVINSWNSGAQRMFGYDESEAVGAHVRTLFTPEDQELRIPEEEIRQARESGKAASDRWLVRKDGSRLFVSGVLVALRDQGVLTELVKIARDLTEGKRLEAALREAHEELEDNVNARTRELAFEVAERRAAEERARRVLKRLISLQEDERRRIARDLHDHIGQQMTALQLRVGTLRKLAAGHAELEPQLAATERIVQQLDRDLRHFAGELRSSALYTFGLEPALTDLVSLFSSTYGIPASFQSIGLTDRRLAPDIEVNLYRIAQEALNNVHKHARASQVDVVIQRRDGEVVLSVIDDGVGFDPSATDRRRLGVIGMRERAALINGHIDIESAPGRGTSVIVSAPTVFSRATSA